MRVPWVMRDPDGEGWIMYFTARVPRFAEPNAGGAIGFATSPDIVNWTFQKPIYAGGMFGQMEVPQVFKHGSKWYMVFCTAGEHFSKAYQKFNPRRIDMGTHYLVADDHLGPWNLAPGKFLNGSDPCKRYAGKFIEKDGKLHIMGFRCFDENRNFIGDVSDPSQVNVDHNGMLSVQEEQTMANLQ